jgi:menaquinone-dependent protoporphyrinogen IX oxidase
MPDKILVTYASRAGSTAGVAEFRLSVLFGVWKEGDHRDWNAIRTWAENLRILLEGNHQ